MCIRDRFQRWGNRPASDEFWCPQIQRHGGLLISAHAEPLPTRGNDLGQHARRCRETLAAEVPIAGCKRSINQDILKSSKTGTIARPMSYPTCGNPWHGPAKGGSNENGDG